MSLNPLSTSQPGTPMDPMSAAAVYRLREIVNNGDWRGFFSYVYDAADWRWFIATVLVACGVCIMHYFGTSGMMMRAQVEYDPIVVAGSVLIAVGASGAALLICFALHINEVRFLASFVMGIAVCGMHYTGMLSMVMYFDSTVADPSVTGIATSTVVVSTAVVSLIICVMFLVANSQRQRFAKAKTEQTLKVLRVENLELGAELSRAMTQMASLAWQLELVAMCRPFTPSTSTSNAGSAAATGRAGGVGGGFGSGGLSGPTNTTNGGGATGGTRPHALALSLTKISELLRHSARHSAAGSGSEATLRHTENELLRLLQLPTTPPPLVMPPPSPGGNAMAGSKFDGRGGGGGNNKATDFESRPLFAPKSAGMGGAGAANLLSPTAATAGGFGIHESKALPPPPPAISNHLSLHPSNASKNNNSHNPYAPELSSNGLPGAREVTAALRTVSTNGTGAYGGGGGGGGKEGGNGSNNGQHNLTINAGDDEEEAPTTPRPGGGGGGGGNNNIRELTSDAGLPLPGRPYREPTNDGGLLPGGIASPRSGMSGMGMMGTQEPIPTAGLILSNVTNEGAAGGGAGGGGPQQPQYTIYNVSMSHLLSNPVTLEVIKDVMYKTHRLESLMFYLDVHRFKKLVRFAGISRNASIVRKSCLLSAQLLYETYFDPSGDGAPHMLNVASNVLSAIRTLILDKHEYSGDMWDAALKEVTALMYNNTFRAFAESPAFEWCVQLLNASAQYAPRVTASVSVGLGSVAVSGVGSALGAGAVGAIVSKTGNNNHNPNGPNGVVVLSGVGNPYYAGSGNGGGLRKLARTTSKSPVLMRRSLKPMGASTGAIPTLPTAPSPNAAGGGGGTSSAPAPPIKTDMQERAALGGGVLSPLNKLSPLAAVATAMTGPARSAGGPNVSRVPSIGSTPPASSPLAGTRSN